MAIHLLNPMWDALGGSEQRTISLFELLAPHTDVSVWSEYTPDPRLLGRVPIREMLKANSYPQKGTFVIVGAYWEIGRWMEMARPERVILIYNLPDPEMLEHRLAQLASYGIERVELRFASELMAATAGGRAGTVEHSPIDLERFSPRDVASEGQVVLGRHSRDVAFKHHPGDPALYRKLVSEEIRVRILGGKVLRDRLSDESGIELLAAGSVAPDEFLRSLDIFFYRTDPSWTEAYGRVVAEAMASGLPCVLEDRGGYRELIGNGENGFLFSSEDQALEVIGRLAADSSLRQKIGTAARRTVEGLYRRATDEMLGYYLR